MDANRLHAVPRAKLPMEVFAGNELTQARMEGDDMVILKINLNKGFPVEVGFFQRGLVTDMDKLFLLP